MKPQPPRTPAPRSRGNGHAQAAPPPAPASSSHSDSGSKDRPPRFAVQPGPPESAPQRCRRAILEAMPAMIEAQIATARDGSYLHAKFLLEWAVVSGAPQPTPEELAKQDTLVNRVLQRLDALDKRVPSTEY